MNNVKSLSENIAKAVSETTKHVEFLAAAYPVETYLNKTGLDILEKHENK